MSRPGVRRGPLRIAAAVAILATLLAAVSTRAEVTATHNAIISFESHLFPSTLPRNSTAPVGIRLEAHIKARKRREPAALTTVELAIHKAAHLSHRGLPVCDASLIDPASTAQALAACPGAHIGYGRIRAHSAFPGSRHLHFIGHVTIFNGRLDNGHPAILLHVFSAQTHASFVFPLTVSHRKGRYSTVLTAHVRVGRWSRITDFRLILNRTYRYRGKRQSFLSASCPTLSGFSVGYSPFVVAVLGFADGTQKKIAVIGSCRVRH